MSVRGVAQGFPNDVPIIGHRWGSVIANQYYFPFTMVPGATATAMTINTWFAAPIYFPGLTFTKLCIELTVGGVGNGRIALYDADASTDLPNALKVDSGSFSVNTTGIVENTVSSFTMEDRLYWLAVNASVNATARFGSGNTFLSLTTGTDFQGTRRGVQRAVAFGAPPDPFGTPSATIFGMPLLALK